MNLREYLFGGAIEWVRLRPAWIRALRFFNIAIVSLSMLSYVALWIWGILVSLAQYGYEPMASRLTSFLGLDLPRLWIMIFIIPFVGFVLLSVIRGKLNFPRPYEVYHFSPILNKKTKGKSFPSRHLFSIYLISTVYLVLGAKLDGFSLVPGIVFFVLGDFLGVIRMITGVHFPKDVIVGAFCGILWGLLLLSML